VAGEEHSESALSFHPLDQFIVKPLFGEGPIHWYTPTNVTLWMMVAAVVVILLFGFGSARLDYSVACSIGWRNPLHLHP